MYANLFPLLAVFGGRRDMIQNLTVRFVKLCRNQLQDARAELNATKLVPLTAVEQARIDLEYAEDRFTGVNDINPIDGFGFSYACMLENALKSGDGGLVCTHATAARYEHQMQLAIDRGSEHNRKEQDRATSNLVWQSTLSQL